MVAWQRIWSENTKRRTKNYKTNKTFTNFHYNSWSIFKFKGNSRWLMLQTQLAKEFWLKSKTLNHIVLPTHLNQRLKSHQKILQLLNLYRQNQHSYLFCPLNPVKEHKNILIFYSFLIYVIDFLYLIYFLTYCFVSLFLCALHFGAKWLVDVRKLTA